MDDSAGDGDGPGSHRHPRLSRHHDPGQGTPLWSWTDHRHPLRVARNYLVIRLCRISPSLRLKNWLYRRLGMSVGPRAAWALESTPDVFWPELISIDADAIVGYDATILCHEFLHDELRTGPVEIGERAMVGAGATVLPGVSIGEDARVAANSLVDSDVPPGTTVAGVPARPVE